MMQAEPPRTRAPRGARGRPGRGGRRPLVRRRPGRPGLLHHRLPAPGGHGAPHGRRVLGLPVRRRRVRCRTIGAPACGPSRVAVPTGDPDRTVAEALELVGDRVGRRGGRPAAAPRRWWPGWWPCRQSRSAGRLRPRVLPGMVAGGGGPQRPGRGRRLRRSYLQYQRTHTPVVIRLLGPRWAGAGPRTAGRRAGRDADVGAGRVRLPAPLRPGPRRGVHRAPPARPLDRPHPSGRGRGPPPRR